MEYLFVIYLEQDNVRRVVVREVVPRLPPHSRYGDPEDVGGSFNLVRAVPIF